MYWIALWASLSMVVQDVIGVCLTQAQARDRATLSGFLDMAAWLAAIWTTVWSLNAINGHNLGLKVAVVGGVSVANFVGSWSGVKIGKRYIKLVAPGVHSDHMGLKQHHEHRLSRLEEIVGLR